MARLSLLKKMLLPLMAFMLGFVAFGLVARDTLNHLQVNGPVYQRIMQGKDLVADVLPPPEYIIEAYVLCHQMADAQTSAELTALQQRGDKLRADFEERHTYWSRELPASDMKEALLRASYEPAVAFFKVRDEQFVPALQKGDKEGATRLLTGEMHTLYESHRAAIDKVVGLANARCTADEKEAAATISSRSWFLVIFGVCTAGLSLFLGVAMAGGIVRRVHTCTQGADHLAQGEVDAAARILGTSTSADKASSETGDEIDGLMASFRLMASHIGNVATAAEALARGDTTTRSVAAGRDDKLGTSFDTLQKTMGDLISETGQMGKWAREGRLTERGNAQKFQGAWREVVQGMNQTLDSVVDPLRAGARCIEQIGQGVIPPPITASYQGDFNTLKNSINSCITGLGGLVEANAVLQRMAVNDYTRTVEGNYLGVFEEVKLGIKQVEASFKNGIRITKNIARGDLAELSALKKIGRSSEQDEFLPALIDSMERLTRLVNDVDQLTKAAAEGRLSERADASRHEGQYRKLVEGLNATLEAVVQPLHVAAECMSRIGRGEVPEKITAPWRGDFETLKRDVNACLDGLAGLVEANAVLQRMAVNDYTCQIEGAYVGIFGDVKGAVHEVQGRVKNMIRIMKDVARGELNETSDLKKVGKRSPQDEFLPSLISTMESVSSLVLDMGQLSGAAVEGHLAARGDAARHLGQYRQVIVGVNATLEAVLGPINEASQVLDRLAGRDLTARMENAYQGDLAKIKDALNHAVDNLQEALTSVAMGAEQVASAAQQISCGSQSLAEGASEQAASLEEVSSGLQEMESMTRQNTSNAKEARAMSESARQACDKGTATMRRLTEAMSSIKNSSGATARIIKTIDEIAFQTNLLALNAAVEAARAGDAGKGFAVVAEEVRNLAMRSAEAAKNTSALIQESVQNAEVGANINEEVLRNLDEISGQVRRVSEVMGEIAVASEQQAQGVSQITHAIGQMNAVTQQVAANAEESASAAEELSAQASEMQSLVAQFKLGDSGRASSVGSTARSVARWSHPSLRSQDRERSRMAN